LDEDTGLTFSEWKLFDHPNNKIHSSNKATLRTKEKMKYPALSSLFCHYQNFHVFLPFPAGSPGLSLKARPLPDKRG
jgi:hypothetical protein